MARPNYGFKKRQKEIAKQKKKEAKLKRKQEGVEEAPPEEKRDGPDLDEVLDKVKSRLSQIKDDGDLKQLGEAVLAGADDLPEETTIQLAIAFLDRASAELPDTVPD